MNTTSIMRLLVVAAALSGLASACGGSSHHTLNDTARCFRSHGATVTSTTGPEQDDPDAQVISDFMGFRGSFSGTFHGSDFQVEVFDDAVYVTPSRGAGTVGPLSACFTGIDTSGS
jgi:hypothetical protein